MPDLGIRLQLLAGQTVPLPVPYPVIDSLREVEVTSGGRDRDGFQLTFALGKDLLLEYSLLLSGTLFTSEKLRKARKSGALECFEPRKGKRFYRGSALTAWLSAAATPAAPAAEAPRRRSERWPFPDEIDS